MVEVCAVAKRDLKAGEVLDDYGMYMTYGEAVNVEEMSAGRYLPEGLVEGCKLTAQTCPRMPSSPMTTSCCQPVAWQIGCVAEQYRKFRGETWLQDLLDGAGTRGATLPGQREKVLT